MKKKIYLAFLLISYYAFTQGPPPPGLPDDPPPAVTINETQNILLLAGIALGIYIVRKKK